MRLPLIKPFAFLWLFIFSGLPGILAQSASAYWLGLADESFPEVIWDSAVYDLEFTLTNLDLTADFDGPVTLMLSIDGEAGEPMGPPILLEAPLNPGDSLNLLVPAYQFDATKFSGGGITHDIIVWPMANGVIKHDSAFLTVKFFEWDGPSASDIRIVDDGSFPTQICESCPYNFSFLLINDDPEYPLLEPVSFYMSIDNDAPSVLAKKEVQPILLPGDTAVISVTNYQFDGQRFSGGGITHDIIVWPMAYSFVNSNYLKYSVSYLGQKQLSSPPNSGTIPGTFGGSSGGGLNPGFYPNPGSGQFGVMLIEPLDKPLQLQLFDLQGKVIWSHHEAAVKGVSEVKANLQNLPAGTYIWQMRQGDKVAHGRLSIR